MVGRICLVTLVGLALTTTARADEGRLLFVRGGNLLSQPADSAAAAKIVTPLPDGAAARGLEATQDGKLVVLEMGNAAAWLDGDKWKSAGCTGRARPSPGGECLACPATGGSVLVSTTADMSRPLPPPLREVNFLGRTVDEVVGLTDQGVVAVKTEHPAVRRLLARPGARSHLLVAPDGGRAVAVFGDGDTSRINSFALDGAGVPRRLGGPGVPIAWSWDSQWVLIQEGILPKGETPDEEEPEDEGALLDGGDAEARFLLAAPPRRWRPKNQRKSGPPPEPPAPRTQACAVRAVGGESKCWGGFEAIGFSPDSTHVLLVKEHALYAGRIAGVRPEPPRKLVENVDGPAVWVR